MDYGERLFQAARFVTEMEYQHLAFEEFVRKVQPMVDLFGEGGTGYNTSINPAIKAEFAHAVYRFGHSMLTETVDRDQPRRGPATTSTCSSVPQPAVLHGGRPDAGPGGRQHRPRHDAPDRQRDRRVRHRGAAQQAARPAARPRHDEHGPCPRHRHPDAQRGPPLVLRGDATTPRWRRTRAGRTSASASSTRSRSTTSSRPTAGTRRSRGDHAGRQAGGRGQPAAAEPTDPVASRRRRDESATTDLPTATRSSTARRTR